MFPLLKSKIIKEQRDEHLIVFIDYVGYITTKAGQSDKDRIGEVTRELNNITKDYNCTIFLIAQINRNGSDVPTMQDLKDRGYLTFLTEPNRSSYIKCELDTEYYYNQCSNGYAVVYLDELQKIMDYKNLQGNSIDNTIVLLVFAYFRNKIFRRPNELKPEERTADGITQRRIRLPEAIGSNITAIANELGVHKQTLTKAIDILENELNLIVTDRAYRVKNEDGEFRTLPTLFANAYKREDKYLLKTEEDYSRIEIELKAKNMKQCYQGYKINKRKRNKE